MGAAGTPSGATALGGVKRSAHEIRDGAVDQVQDELQSFLRRRPACRRLREAERRHRDDVRAEPNGHAEWQSNRSGDTRRDGGDPAIERADAGSESVVDQVACEWLLVLGQRTVKEPAREAIGDLHGGILVLVLVGGPLLASGGADSGKALVYDAHRAGSDYATHETRDCAAPNAHDRGLVGLSLSLTPLRFGSR